MDPLTMASAAGVYTAMTLHHQMGTVIQPVAAATTERAAKEKGALYDMYDLAVLCGWA